MRTRFYIFEKKYVMKKYLGALTLFLSISFLSCDKDDDQNLSSVPGCTDELAFNYDPNATEDDGSCLAVIEGCTDESAYNYDSNANTDDGSCDYSIASQFEGEWNILQLEYEASIDISPLVSSLDPAIQLLLLGLGNQITLDGEAADAGSFNLNYADLTYESNLDFETEEQTIIAALQIPSVPVNVQAQGSWDLQNDDQYLVFTDSFTGLEQVYDIISLTDNTVYMKGVINLSTDELDLGGDISILELLGSDFELPISIDLYLERVN